LPNCRIAELPNCRIAEFKDLSATLSPRPFPPRRAGKGANSRIWPTLFTEVLHAEGQWANTGERMSVKDLALAPSC
jgi:hypothetical protein